MINDFNYDFLFREIQQELKAEVARMRETVPDFAPGLAIVQVGGREDSNVYIRMKIKAASDIGIVAQHVKLPKSITEIEVILIYFLRLVKAKFNVE